MRASVLILHLFHWGNRKMDFPLILRLLVILFILYFGFPLVLGPFALKASHVIGSHPQLQSLSTSDLHPDEAEFFFDLQEPLAALGYQFIGYMHLIDHIPDSRALLGLYLHPSRTYAVPSVIKGDEGTLFYLEFASIFTDDHEICVNNSPTIGTFHTPYKKVFRYPAIQDATMLHQIHEQIVTFLAEGRQRKNIPSGFESKMTLEFIRKEMEVQVAQGLYFQDASANMYRLTWKGALIMTIRNVAPFLQLRTFLDQQKANRIWQKAQAQIPG
jgi:hypothetical protein